MLGEEEEGRGENIVKEVFSYPTYVCIDLLRLRNVGGEKIKIDWLKNGMQGIKGLSGCVYAEREEVRNFSGCLTEMG